MAAKTKRFTRATAIVAAVIITLAALVLVLYLVKVTPAPKLADPDAVYVITNGSYSYTQGNPAPYLKDASTEDGKKNYTDFMAAYRATVTFSSIQGILEGKWFPSPTIETYEDEDENVLNKEYTPEDINSLTGNTTKILVVFKYNTLQTAKIDGVEMEFDRVYMFISTSANELLMFPMYFAKSSMLEPMDEEYVTYKFTCVGITSKLFDYITES